MQTFIKVYGRMIPDKGADEKDIRWVLKADHLAALEAEKKKWRCYRCGFETSDKAQAEAHFGGEEGEVSLCVAWTNMDESERMQAFQAWTVELNETREENIVLEAAMKEKDKYNRKLLDENIDLSNENAAQRKEKDDRIAALREELSSTIQTMQDCIDKNSQQAEEIKILKGENNWLHRKMKRTVDSAFKQEEGKG